jgi:BTB/POZ domain-containing protein KCTD9
MANSLPPKAELRASFKLVYDGPDRLQREYDLVKESNRLGMDLETYRRLYELRGEMSVLGYPEETQWFKQPSAWFKYIWNLPKNRILPLSWKAAIKLLKNASIVAAIPIVYGAVRYVLEEPKREKQAHLQSWQIINLAQGQTGEGGRIQALQDLAKDDENLEGVKVSDTFLNEVQLPNAKLDNANFQNTKLKKANLKNANLHNANLKNANLHNANLNNANLNKANLNSANLNKANLIYANLNSANLGGATLIYSDLGMANLNGADLSEANIGGADLSGANLSGADLGGAHLEGATNIKPEQIKMARNWRDGCYDPDLLQKLNISQNPKCDEKMKS